MSKKEKWCKYCAKCSTYGRHYACWQGNLLKIVLFGPDIVPFDGWCNKFKFHERYKSGQKTR